MQVYIRRRKQKQLAALRQKQIEAYNSESKMSEATQRPEFGILDLQGKQYKRWVSDVEQTFIGKGYTIAIKPPAEGEGEQPTPELKAQALMFLRRHIDPTLKQQYLRKTDPKDLWDTLKTRFDNVLDSMLPELQEEWNNIRLLDFNEVQDFQQAMLNLQSNLEFCGVAKTDAEMMEKTFTTFPEAASMLSHEYRESYAKGTIKNFSDLMNALQRKERHQLLILNNARKPKGPKFFSEAHYAQSTPQKRKNQPSERQAPPPRQPPPPQRGRGGTMRGGRGQGRTNSWNRASNAAPPRAAAPSMAGRGRGQGRGRGRFGNSKRRGGYASSNRSYPCTKCGATWHTPQECDTPADIQASYKKHKQYMESMESHYVEEYEEYEEEPEAYDVNLCIDDFQDPKRLKTQKHETGDYE